MIAVDNARLTLAFTGGLLAAINPCGFVLLPTYLMYFLGMENLRPSDERASIGRALAVGLSVSGGFMAVFVVLGAITKWSTYWFVNNLGWLGLVIGVALVIFGIAMLFGYRLPFTTPKLNVGQRDRTVRSMFVFGVAFAVASFGCTIPLFIGNVLGSITASGIATGIIAIALYGLGMALVVTSLTVTLSVANAGMLRLLRRGMAWFEYLSGAFVLLTGVYLTWYWYNGLTDRTGDRLLGRAETWQNRLANVVRDNQTAIVVVATAAIAAAVATSLVVRRDNRST